MDFIALLNSAPFALAVNFAVALGGALIHFGKKKFRGQTEAQVRDWIFSHPFSVLSTIGAICIVFLYSIKDGGFLSLTQQSLSAAIGVGYIADSMFNKNEGDKDA